MYTFRELVICVFCTSFMAVVVGYLIGSEVAGGKSCD